MKNQEGIRKESKHQSDKKITQTYGSHHELVKTMN